MWLLIVGMCMQVSLVEVECRVEAVSIAPSRSACIALIRPTREMWQGKAQAEGLDLIFLGVACKGGKVA